MIKPLHFCVLLFTLFLSTVCGAQEDVAISQYIHNQYTINPAFAGSRNCLSIFGAYRKQWVGVDESPSKQILSFNSPLKNDKMALGLLVVNNKIAIYQETKISASYAYRIRITKASQLAFGVNAGMNLNSANYQMVSTIQSNDPLFSTNKTRNELALGAGLAWYGTKFYASLSLPSLLYSDPNFIEKAQFQPLKINYLFSTGYLFQTSEAIGLQPSCLVRFDPTRGTVFDAGGTIVYNNIIWATVAYRTLGEVVAMAAIQPISTLKIGYSFDFTMGNLAKFGSGSHEISIQYDFGYKVKSSNPKFF